jgi:hypothetical protein
MRNEILIVFVLFVTLITISCRNENTNLVGIIERPKDLINKDSMVNILVDIHLADAIVTHSEYINDEKRKFSYSAYKSVFEKHNLTKLRFENSISYYSLNQDELKNIYDSVLVKMSNLEGGSMAKEVKAEKKK